jgi:hypothetical protein
MVLDPLTEVGIGVFVAVVIGRRQLVVHILRDGERGQSKQDDDHPQGDDATEQRGCLARSEHHKKLFKPFRFIYEQTENPRQTIERPSLLSSHMDFSLYFRIS